MTAQDGIHGFHIGTEYGVTYHYDNAGTSGQLTGTGRFKRITGPGLPAYGVHYSYTAGSNLLFGWKFKTGADDLTKLAEVVKGYDPSRDLLASVSNWASGTLGTFSSYTYGYDELGRRKSVVNGGSQFSPAELNKWGYNPKSELVSSYRHEGDNPDEPGDEITPERRLYTYDQIGNRLESTEGTASATTYGANDVNAYDWLQPPSPDPQEYFCYDEDGNLLRDGKATLNCPGTDGLREYKWDAENRLVEVVPVSPSNDPPRNKKVKFVYDYMGRRVRKEVFTYDNGWPQDNDPDEQWHFVYDGWTLDTPRLAGRDGLHGSPGALPIAASQGWNVVMVLDGLNSNATTRKYTWGLDLSGTIHGAGGIGGLLACEEPQAVGDPNRYWFMYDANGNVGQVLDATDTGNISIAAHYEYDPYGHTITATGSYAAASPWRFSTKWHDTELPGNVLIYYGYRYLCRGRWLSRDVIGEMGGEGLYLFAINNPIGNIDSLGMFTCDCTKPAGQRGGIKTVANCGPYEFGLCPSSTTCPVSVTWKNTLLPGAFAVNATISGVCKAEVTITVTVDCDALCNLINGGGSPKGAVSVTMADGGNYDPCLCPVCLFPFPIFVPYTPSVTVSIP